MKIQNKITVVFIVLAIIVLLIVIQLFKYPLKRFTFDFYHPFFVPIQKVENMTAKQALMLQNKTLLVDELLRFQQLNEKIFTELNLLHEVKKENTELKDLLGLKSKTGYKPLFAEIFRRDPGLWNATCFINKGSSDGIIPGCVVLCRIPRKKNSEYVFAVVGRVFKVSKYESQIETVISQNCRLSVILKHSMAAGILEGGVISNETPLLNVTKLPAFKTYFAGEAVVTSGLSRYTTPPSLLVGYIAGTEKKPNIQIVTNLYATAKVIPAVDFAKLHYLVVLIPKPPSSYKSEE